MDKFFALTRARLIEWIEAIAAAVAPWSAEDTSVLLQRRDEIVDRWLQRFSSRSVRAYSYDFQIWVTSLNSPALSDSPLAPGTLSTFLRKEYERGVALRSVVRRGSTIRMMLRDFGLLTEARRQELVQVARRINKTPLPSRPVASLPYDVLERIVRAIDPGDPRDVRDAALAALFLDTMARPSEVLGLLELGTWLVPPVKVSELTRCRDGSGRLPLRVLNGRRVGVAEPVYLSRRVMERIDAWLAISGVRSGPLFRAFGYQSPVTAASPAYAPGRLCRTLRRLAKLAGLRQDLTPSSLRAFTVNKMLTSGLHLDDVRRAARLSTLSTVSRLDAKSRESGSCNDVLRRLQSPERARSPRNYGSPPCQLDLL